jgi:predicted methyltransferase
MKRIGVYSLVLFATACAASAPPPSAAMPPAPPPSPAASAVANEASPASPPSAAPPSAFAPTLQHVTTVELSPIARAVVESSDRSAEDRAIDAGRRPAELLSFAKIATGMHVAEIGAGFGYTTELLARTVGPMGVVYAENNKFFLEHFAAKPWNERLAKPALKNVVRVDRELDDPLPPEAKNLDAVFIVLLYHDTVWLGTDRDKMNRAVFAALKPGGEYIVVDHSAKDGDALNDVKTLHRIDEHTLVAEVTRAGFHLASEGDFLRNPSDARDWNDSPVVAADRRGKSDRFVLQFVKP